VRALRVAYVGELGWELYCPMEYRAALWRPHGGVGGRRGRPEPLFDPRAERVHSGA
jgi:hypothetical protein